MVVTRCSRWSLAALLLAGCQAGREADLDLSRPVGAVSGETAAAARMLAEEPPAAGPADADLDGLTYARCLDLALAHNRAAQRSALAVRRTGLQRSVARREVFDPRLTATSTVEDTAHDHERRAFGNDVTVRSGVTLGGVDIEPWVSVSHDDVEAGDDAWSGTVGVAVSRQLVRVDEALRRRLPLTRSERDLLVAVNSRLIELRDLTVRAATAYCDVLRGQERERIRSNRVADSRTFLAAVQAKVDNGFSPPLDFANARTGLAQAEADLLRERTTLANAREALLGLLGCAPTRPLALAAQAVGDPPDEAIALDRDAALVRAGHERVLNHLANLEVLRQEWRVAVDRLRPDAEAALELSHRVEGDGPFASDEGTDNTIGVSLTVNLPLDGWAAERAQAAQNRLRLRELASQLADERDTLERDLRQQHRRLVEARASVALYRDLLESERTKLAAVVQRYESGTVDNLEVTRAKQAVDAAELNLLEARIAGSLALVRYRSLLPAVTAPAGPGAADAPAP